LLIADFRLDFSRAESNRQSQINNRQCSCAPVAQLEECDASNVEVAGSSPARSSKAINK